MALSFLILVEEKPVNYPYVQISVIIVVHNNLEVLKPCLVHLAMYLQRGRDEVLVVDNASTDGVRDWLESTHPWVRYVAAGSNLGFGRANNLGASLAQGQYFFFLNPDTEVHGDLMGTALAFFSSPESIGVGVAGFPVLNQQGKPEVSAGNFPGLWSLTKELLLPGRLFPHRLRKKRHTAFDEVDYISGADLFVPRRYWDVTGGFDPDFFLYYEETEWQYRMKKLGLKRVLLPSPSLLHHVGTSDHKVSLHKIKIFEKSRILFYQKVFGNMAGAYCRTLLSLFYASRWLMGKGRHYRLAAKEVWHV